MLKAKGRQPDSRLATVADKDGSKDLTDAEWKSKLTPQQYRILRGKGTDMPRSHPYDDLYAPGKYFCAGCDTLLYTSEMKFDCGCGWPGFWTNVSKAVREEPPARGRTHVEIVCNACNGHLGHVFAPWRAAQQPAQRAPLRQRKCPPV